MNTQWLWEGQTLPARLARLSLLPPSWIYRSVTAVRYATYRWGVRRPIDTGTPVISVGNLAVGGSGKTPIAAWIAGHYAAQGLQPGVVLRDYGNDEAAVHRRLCPRAVVVPDANRVRGIRHAVGRGARVVVLDDAFQRLDVVRSLNLVLVGAESLGASRRRLPAGPWREGWNALERADLVVVTRKSVSAGEARHVADRLASGGHAVAVAALQVGGVVRLDGRPGPGLDELRGREALVVSGIGNPASLRRQCERLGLDVTEKVFRDHHRFTGRDVDSMLQAGAGLDYVVVTEKDAVKLRPIWPTDRPDPLVAQLGVTWEYGADHIQIALARVAATAGSRPAHGDEEGRTTAR